VDVLYTEALFFALHPFAFVHEPPFRVIFSPVPVVLPLEVVADVEPVILDERGPQPVRFVFNDVPKIIVKSLYVCERLHSAYS
jgi:hypothetical protein